MSAHRVPRPVTGVPLLALVVALLVPGPAAAGPVASARHVAPAACTTPAGPDAVTCLSVVRAAAARPATPGVAAAPVPDGVTPSQLRAVYGTTGLTAPAGTTVGIVVPYDAPDVEADLARFRATFGLSACTTANGCFRKVDQRGVTVPAGKSTTSTAAPVYSAAWEAETTLDTQAVSAMCPSCAVLVVEADDTQLSASLGPALLRAQNLGATVISNSFAVGENDSIYAADRDWWSRVSVPVFAGSGDHGYENFGATSGAGTSYYPASSPSVISVGGTSATLSGNQVTSEKAWSGAGSGCAFDFARPASQAAYFAAIGDQPDDLRYCDTTTGQPSRASADVSAFADLDAPGFPLAIDGTWKVAGGTSLAVQLVAALAAYAGARPPGTSIADVAYGLAARAAPTGLADVTTGTNDPAGGSNCGAHRVCVARAGWDGPTGLGTPRGLSVFAPLLTVAPTTSVPGGRVTASGADFVPGEQVTVTGADGGVLATTTAATDGTYAVPVTLPSDDPSPVALTVTGAVSGFTATRSITLGTPTLTLTPSTPTDEAVVPLEQVTATLTNFGARERVTVTFPGGSTSSVVAASNGSATTTVAVPVDATGTATATAFGTVTGLGATATATVAVPAAGPPFQQVRVGATATVTVSGFGAGETLTATDTDGGVLATGPATGDGTATLTWTAPTGTTGTAPVTVTGALTGRVATTQVDLLAATGEVPLPPTVLSVVPTTAGGVTVGLRAAATGPVPTSVTVLTSTGALGTRVPVAPGGDAFVTVDAVPAGTTLTVQALAGNAVGDSAPSLASVPVTANTADGTGDLTPVGPVRLTDTRVAGSALGPGPIGSGGARTLPVAGHAGVPPTGVAAVVLSVTVVAPSASTYLTFWPSGQARPLVSNANVGPGVVKASLVKVPLGNDGAVQVFNFSGSTNVVVDVVGFYAAGRDSTGRTVLAHNQSFASTAAATRLLDTRSLPASPLRAAGGAIAVPVRGRGGVPADATGVELQVQAVAATKQGYLTVFPSTAAQPFVSQVQFDRNRPGITAVLATLGADGSVTVFANAGTEVIVDVVGWYAPSAAGRFVPVAPRRYLDTRPASGGAGPVVPTAPRSVRLAGGRALDGSSQVPASATAVAFSLTSTDNTAPAFVTAWPAGAARPFATSLLPDPAAGIYDNLVLSGVGSGGAVSLFVNAGTVNLVLDVQGYYTTTP